VISWYTESPATTITDIIFDIFLEKDYTLYNDTLSHLQSNYISITKPPPTDPRTPLPLSLASTPPSSTHILQARTWLKTATHLIISAGAGLSAATGLDYTSPALFAKYFPAFHSKGLHKLYDVFGFKDWDSDLQKWGYYFTHLDMVRSWPASPVYAKLLDLVGQFGSNYFIRTTNADGFFVKNKFDARRVATPQGSYGYLQCFAKCRADAVFEAEGFVDKGLPFIDPVSQCLTDGSLVPRCKFCSGEVTLCVRGGDYFNDGPFKAMEMDYRGFVKGLQGREGVSVVILELGVGLNTPGVLRWPNEDLVSESDGFKLIRVGMDASGCVPWELEEEGVAVGITGDIKVALDALLS
jgi:NAD-dependent SIR2 family protein deacetylase